MFTTVGAEQEYFLIDEQYYFERPDLYTTGRTLFGAKPPKGQELDEHYFGSIPERVLAFMLESEQELRKLGVPVKTRHNEVAPAQYEIAPIFENSNVGSDHQQITMQVLQNVARRYGLVCLLHEKPFAGLNGSGKHNNWSMGTDTGINLLDPGDTPRGERAVPVLLRGGPQGRRRAPGAAARLGGQRRARTTAWAPTRRRRRSSRSSSAPSCENAFGTIATGAGRRRPRRATSGWAPTCCPQLPLHGGDRNRTSPFAFTGNKFEFRALGLEHVARLPEHGPEHDRRPGRRRDGGRARAAPGGRRGARSTPSPRSSSRSGTTHGRDRLRRRRLLRGVARGGRAPRAGEPAHDARRAAVADRGPDGRGLRALQGALPARARGALRGVRRAVRDEAEHRGRDGRLAGAHVDPAGGRPPPDRGPGEPASRRWAPRSSRS